VGAATGRRCRGGASGNKRPSAHASSPPLGCGCCRTHTLLGRRALPAGQAGMLAMRLQEGGRRLLAHCHGHGHATGGGGGPRGGSWPVCTAAGAWRMQALALAPWRWLGSGGGACSVLSVPCTLPLSLPAGAGVWPSSRRQYARAGLPHRQPGCRGPHFYKRLAEHTAFGTRDAQSLNVCVLRCGASCQVSHAATPVHDGSYRCAAPRVDWLPARCPWYTGTC